jgi:cytoskeletal protein CcmA (bactofilin family)
MKKIAGTSIISKGTILRGDVTMTTDELFVEGLVAGNGELAGTLIISRFGLWKGNVNADVVVLHGRIEGDVVARTRIELHGEARLLGRAYAPALLIKAGARLWGETRTGGAYVQWRSAAELESKTVVDLITYAPRALSTGTY